MANALRSSPSGCRWQQQCALSGLQTARAETSAAASKTTALAKCRGLHGVFVSRASSLRPPEVSHRITDDVPCANPRRRSAHDTLCASQ